MDFFLVFGVAFALAMDAFAVSVGISAAFPKLTKKQIYRVAFYFGFFQFMMPVAGWFSGKNIQMHIEAFSHWVAFGLLLVVGGKMIFESLNQKGREKSNASDPTRGSSLLLLSVATSIDALAVGLSLAFLRVGIVYPAVIIGVVAFVMTVLGMNMGSLLGRIVKKGGEMAGGIILIFIGLLIIL